MADFKDGDLVDEGALRADVAHARERYEAAQRVALGVPVVDIVDERYGKTRPEGP